MKQSSLQLCPTCNTMKRFDGDMCVRCEGEKTDWEKKIFDKYPPRLGYMVTGELIDFIRTTIQQAVAQERERIVKDVKKMKWKNTPKTMLTSYYNGFIGYHKGDGVHIPHTIGSHEDMQHSHYNEAVEDVINIITNNHEDHKE